MKKIFVGVLFSLIILPVAAHAVTAADLQAQVQALLEQIRQLQMQLQQLQNNATSTSPIACTADAKMCSDGSSVGRVGPRCEFAACPGEVTRPRWCDMYVHLMQGSRGSEVTALQRDMGMSELGSSPTGYYGNLTYNAWMRRCGVVKPNCPVYQAPICAFGTHPVGGGYMNNGCPLPTRCVSDVATTSTITVSSFSGPTMLVIGQSGTWTIQARSSATNTLSYSIIWGDESILDRINALAFGSTQQTVTQNTSFTHIYQHAGTYTVFVTVVDTMGGKATGSVSVRVVGTNIWNPSGTSTPIACPQIIPVTCSSGWGTASFVYDEKGCPIQQMCAPTTTISTNMSCTIHRTCGDLVVPNGGTVGTSRSCGSACPVPQTCMNGTLMNTGSAGDYSWYANNSVLFQYELSCSPNAYTP